MLFAFWPFKISRLFFFLVLFLFSISVSFPQSILQNSHRKISPANHWVKEQNGLKRLSPFVNPNLMSRILRKSPKNFCFKWAKRDEMGCFCPLWASQNDFRSSKVFDMVYFSFFYLYKPVPLHEYNAVVFHQLQLNSILQIEQKLDEAPHPFLPPQDDSSISTIPRKIHMIWLTSPQNPSELPERYLHYLATTSKNAILDEFQMFLWTNVPKKDFKESFFRLKSVASSIRVKSIEEMEKKLAGTPIESLILKLKAKNSWAKLSDIYRFPILEKHGGIYMDMDAILKKPIGFLCENYETIGFRVSRNTISVVELFFIGVPPNHPIIKGVLKGFGKLDQMATMHPMTEPFGYDYRVFVPVLWSILYLSIYFEETPFYQESPLDFHDVEPNQHEEPTSEEEESPKESKRPAGFPRKRNLLLEKTKGLGFVEHKNEMSWMSGEFNQASYNLSVLNYNEKAFWEVIATESMFFFGNQDLF